LTRLLSDPLAVPLSASLESVTVRRRNWKTGPHVPRLFK
jgi:hypothetical protein